MERHGDRPVPAEALVRRRHHDRVAQVAQGVGSRRRVKVVGVGYWVVGLAKVAADLERGRDYFGIPAFTDTALGRRVRGHFGSRQSLLR